jgi:hypothetical protein
MAITTYSELKGALADFLARSDLTDRIPDFIALAEARLSRAIRAKDMQTSSTITVTSGIAALPSDYEEWMSCRYVGTVPSVTQDLAYVEPDAAEWRFRFRPNGYPQMFTIIGGALEIRPQGTTGSVKLYYYKSLISEALSDGNATNWLLDKCPDIYLYTSVAEANIYMKDEARAGEFLALAKSEAEKEGMSADAGKFKMNPMRVVDTGAATGREAGNGGMIGQ